MNIGRLNRRVDILTTMKKKDEYGGELIEWAKTKSVWAYISPKSGNELFRSQQPEAQNVTTITIRYIKDISVLNRIKYQEKIFEIIGVSDIDSDHKTITLNCKEIIKYGV